MKSLAVEAKPTSCGDARIAGSANLQNPAISIAAYTNNIAERAFS